MPHKSFFLSADSVLFGSSEYDLRDCMREGLDPDKFKEFMDSVMADETSSLSQCGRFKLESKHVAGRFKAIKAMI